MARRPMLDSDIVIDYLRRNPAAVAFVRSLSERPLISAVTVGELYSGVRDGKEREELQNLVIGFRVLPVTRDIAIQAGLYGRQFRKSHGVELADALNWRHGRAVQCRTVHPEPEALPDASGRTCTVQESVV